MTRLTLLAVAMLSAPCTALAWGDCDETAARDLTLDAAGVDALVLAARAGQLRIEGDPAQTRIVVQGKACASDADLLAAIQLVSSRSGARQTIEVQMPELGSWGNEQAWLDLVLRVPARLALEVSDSSGDADVSGVASLDASDSSGDLDVRDIGGDVRLRDSSGDIEVVGVTGSVEVENDSSGNIMVRDVGGAVRILRDSSGDITLRDVAGDATVERDGSGSITFDRIGGHVLVGEDGSGSIRAEGVGGDFTVQRDGSGGVSHREVLGRVSIPAR